MLRFVNVSIRDLTSETLSQMEGEFYFTLSEEFISYSVFDYFKVKGPENEVFSVCNGIGVPLCPDYRYVKKVEG